MRGIVRCAALVVLVTAVACAQPAVGATAPPSVPPESPSAAASAGPSPAGLSTPSALPSATQALGSAACQMRGELPDPVCTPGAVDPRVTQADLATTICLSGYTQTVRPPVAYTDGLKRQGMADYGFTDPISDHEEDHLIPLELGGSPSDPRNLWPEPGRSPNPKDAVENRLHLLVCSGQVPLARAQQAIATDWTTAVAVAEAP